MLVRVFSCAAVAAAVALGTFGAVSLAQTTTSYTYDAVGQLTSVARSSGTVAYGYDQAGNRTLLTGGNAVPTAGNLSATVSYNTSNSLSLPAGGAYTSVSVQSGASHGVVTTSANTATYTPASGYTGADSFSYVAVGPGGTSTPGTVSLTVNAQ